MATNKDGKGKCGNAWRRQTQAVRGGQIRTPFQETSEALFMTAGYAYEDPEEAEARFKGAPGYTYTRYGNPTISMFEERVALLEGAQVGRATASGMAAVTASLLCCLRQGDHVVAAKALFGAIRFVLEDILARYGISVTLVNGTDPEAWRKAIRKETKIAFLETPSNPMLEIVDLKAVADIAHERGVLVFVDNCFASPALQRPMAFGADVVIHSTTKFIDGQGRGMGGIILCSQDFLNAHLQIFLRNTGPSMSPFNAWLHVKSLETLDLRMRVHSANAAIVADFLAKQRKVVRVLYPFRSDHPQQALAKKQMSAGGGIVTFEVEGGKDAGFAVARALKLIDISNNLGDAKSLITHPATTTHQRLTPEARAEAGISDSMLRIAVGLEDVEDICEDMEQALARIDNGGS